MRQAIALDTIKPLEQAQVRLRQGEKGSTELYFVVSEDGRQLDLSDYDSVLFVGVCNDVKVEEECTVDALGNALLTVTENMTKEAGRYTLAYLKLVISDSYLVTCQAIDVEVLPGVEGY